MEFSELKEQFEALYNEKTTTEQSFQDLIEKHTTLAPRSFKQNHGVHLDILFSKSQIGNNYVSDFMFISKSSVDWNIVHIEIEDPRKKIFTKSSGFTAEFNAALKQVEDWSGWLQRSENQIAYKIQIEKLLRPANMANNPINHKFILVYGRRNEINTDIKKSSISVKKKENLDIMTFDSLFEKPKEVLHIGKFKKNIIEIYHRKDIDKMFFSFLNPSDFSLAESELTRIKKSLDIDHQNSQNSTSAIHRLHPNYYSDLKKDFEKVIVRKN